MNRLKLPTENSFPAVKNKIIFAESPTMQLQLADFNYKVSIFISKPDRPFIEHKTKLIREHNMRDEHFYSIPVFNLSSPTP